MIADCVVFDLNFPVIAKEEGLDSSFSKQCVGGIVAY